MNAHAFSKQWTDCIVEKVLKKVEMGKFITTTLKSILKLVKLQSLVAKRCEIDTNMHRENGINFQCVIQKYVQNSQPLQGYIFLILQHFTTKLCNFINFRMLFNAVVMNFPTSTFFKILSIMQSVKKLLASFGCVKRCLKRTRMIFELLQAFKLL